MVIEWAFTIHPEHKEQVREELKKLRSAVEKHGGRNFRYYASANSEHPNRMLTYEFDKFAHLDELATDPGYRAVKLDSLWTNVAGRLWTEVAL
jgi:quinol monooxygenase YgiN